MPYTEGMLVQHRHGGFVADQSSTIKESCIKSLSRMPCLGGSVGDPDPEPDPAPHFLGLPDPDPLVRDTDTDPDPALILPFLTKVFSGLK